MFKATSAGILRSRVNVVSSKDLRATIASLPKEKPQRNAARRATRLRKRLGLLGHFPVFNDSTDHATMLTLANATLHPSGTLDPSRADLAITRSLRDALALVDVRLVDHFIVAGSGSYSLAENGQL
ncbi:JAB domain-containing protein [Bordetella genomosp. 11]